MDFIIIALIVCGIFNITLSILDIKNIRKIKIKRRDDETDESYEKRQSKVWRYNFIIGTINIVFAIFYYMQK